MVRTKVRTRFDAKKVLRKKDRAQITTMQRGAAATRLTMRRSLRKRKRPSPPGRPPSSPTGLLRRSIVYSVERRGDSAVIGPSFRIANKVGGAHDSGVRFKGNRYPDRPFAAPALEKVRDRLPSDWAGVIR